MRIKGLGIPSYTCTRFGPVIERFLRNDHYFTRDVLHQQFHGTILMVFDLPDFDEYCMFFPGLSVSSQDGLLLVTDLRHVYI